MAVRLITEQKLGRAARLILRRWALRGLLVCCIGAGPWLLGCASSSGRDDRSARRAPAQSPAASENTPAIDSQSATSVEPPAVPMTSLEQNRPGTGIREYEGRRIGGFVWGTPEVLASGSPAGEEGYAPIVEVLKRRGLLRPGMVIADVGAGGGTLSLMLAREVGEEGRVYAVEIQPAVVGYI